jgi:hypothetical protein
MIGKKLKFLMAALLVAAVIGSTYTQTVLTKDEISTQANLIKLVIGILISVVVAVALMPTIGNQTHGLVKRDAAKSAGSQNFSSTERTLLDLWPLMAILGVFVGIIAMAIA